MKKEEIREELLKTLDDFKNGRIKRIG